jgi:hypothetical protein
VTHERAQALKTLMNYAANMELKVPMVQRGTVDAMMQIMQVTAHACMRASEC